MGTAVNTRSLDELLELYNEAYAKDILPYAANPLYEPFYYFISQPGKRIRPLLLLAAADLFGGDVEEALPAAFAIELFHNFSLVHDDIMDEASVRRGRPAVHVKYGNNRAILAGDMMFIHVYKQLARSPEQVLAKALHVFNRAAEEVIEGQELDMKFEKEKTVALEDYLKMIEYKTSVLLAAALRIGAILGEASPRDLDRIYDFGLNMGLAFQIKDDWLDAFGEGEKFGKRIGGDIVQNKKTCLYIEALERAGEAKRRQLQALQSEPDQEKKIRETLNIFEELGIREWGLELSQSYYRKAEAKLTEIDQDDKRKETLSGLAESIFLRDH